MRMVSHRALRLCGMMFIMLLSGLSGCLFVWEEEEFYPPMSLSPKPEIAMSRNTVELHLFRRVGQSLRKTCILHQMFLPSLWIQH